MSGQDWVLKAQGNIADYFPTRSQETTSLSLPLCNLKPSWASLVAIETKVEAKMVFPTPVVMRKTRQQILRVQLYEKCC